MIRRNYPDFGFGDGIWGISYGAINAALDFREALTMCFEENAHCNVCMSKVHLWSVVLYFCEYFAKF